MARTRDLGINVIPVAEPFQTAAYHAAVKQCQICQCDNTNRGDTSVACSGNSDWDINKEKKKKRALGFAHHEVAQLKGQLRARLRNELDH